MARNINQDMHQAYQPDSENFSFSMVNNVLQPLVITGAINWGLVSAFDFNIVEAIFGVGTFAKAIYGMIGLAGLIELAFMFRNYGRNLS